MPELRAQRTLVKSPPELWAQVSDPVSLSRHLGEFGEIKITRVVPEHTVAWEGERASGTVELSSSGWGTKVTLVAQLTEDADPDSQPDAAAAEAPAAETRPADAFELINSLAREPLPLPRIAEPLGEAQAEPDQGAAAETAPDELSTPVEAAPIEPEAQHEHTDAPGGERAQEAHKADDVTVDEPAHGLDDWFSQSPGQTDAAGDPSAWAAHASAAAAAEARPGFFARLFGRRRRGTSTVTPPPSAPEPIEPEGVVSPASVLDHEVAPFEAAGALAEHEASPSEAAETAWTEHEVAPTEAAEAAWSEHDGAPTESAEAAWTEHEVAPTEAAEAAMTEHDVAPTEAPDAGPTEHDVALTDAEPVAEPAAIEPTSDQQAPEPAGDPVEVLDHARAEAVLTAVLDDLGAARHRPFSRG